MKKHFLLFFALIPFLSFSQILYVKADATGANTGLSWTDAFNSLDNAIGVSTANQVIWVAKGTYKPSLPAPNNFFIISEGIKLYGGFAGTETSLSQRDIAANPTILSGDILGDDIPGNFSSNRSDNCRHVLVSVVIVDNPGNEVDGFIITNGHTLTGSAAPAFDRNGGGMLVQAKTTVRNSQFKENFGENGAALSAVDALSDQILVENCLFENNKCTDSGICLLSSTPTGSVSKSIFRNNKVVRGALYPANTVNIQIDSCLFERNIGKDTSASNTIYGGGMFSWQASFTLKNSIFRQNVAENAAGIYIDNRDGGDFVTIDHCLFEQDSSIAFGGSGIFGWQATFLLKNSAFKNNVSPSAAGVYCNGQEFDSQYSIENCLFEGNKASSFGGSGIYNNKTSYTMANCTFKNNTAPSSGAAMYNGETTVFNVSDCLFEGNQSKFAGAVANYGIGCNGTFNNCTFKTNGSTSGGGACSNGFKAQPWFVNCHFTANTAGYGGAIFSQNDTTRLQFDGCVFDENNSTGTAGAIFVNSKIKATIANCAFNKNIGTTGGAIHAVGDSLISITNTFFLENIATTQGAGLNLAHANAVLTNCLFAKNINTGAGAGGAISNNASDNETSSLRAINCTFADNVAAIGAGVAQWEEALGNANATFQNCLFQNPDGENYTIEDGQPTVVSLGGNQSSDQSLEPYLMASKDLNGVTNNFIEPNDNNYRQTFGSPATNSGVADGAPLNDITGALRVGNPDVGAFENSTSGASTPGIETTSLQCAPNPAKDQTTLTIENEVIGKVEISVWNQEGRLVFRNFAEKTTQAFKYSLDIHAFADGMYTVRVSRGQEATVGRFSKVGN